MATNYEILMGCSRKQMAAFINSLVNKEVSRYIDWNAWLRSEDPDPVYFGTEAFFKENGEEIACRLLEETGEDSQRVRTVYMLLDKGDIRRETVPAWFVRKADEEFYPAAPLPEISEEEILQTASESDSILEELLAETEIVTEPAVNEEPLTETEETAEEQPQIQEEIPEEPQAEQTPAAEEEAVPETETLNQEVLSDDDEDELPEIVMAAPAAEAVPAAEPAADESPEEADASSDEQPAEETEETSQQTETEPEEIPATLETAQAEAETVSARGASGSLNLDELLFGDEDEEEAESSALEKTAGLDLDQLKSEAAEDQAAATGISLDEIAEAKAEEEPAELPEDGDDDLQFDVAEDIPVREEPVQPAAQEENLSLDELLFGKEDEDEEAPAMKLNTPEEDEFSDISLDSLLFDEEEDTVDTAEDVQPSAEEENISLNAAEAEPAEAAAEEPAGVEVDDDIWKAFEDAVEEADRAEEEAVRNFTSAAEEKEEPAAAEKEDEKEDDGNEFFARGRIEMLKESLFDEDEPPVNTGDLVFQETTAIEFPRNPSEGNFPQEHEPAAAYTEARTPKHMAKKAETSAVKQKTEEDDSFYSRLKKMSEESDSETEKAEEGDTFSRIFDEPNPFEEEEEADFRSDGLKRFLDDIKRDSMLYDPDDPEDQELPTIAFSPMDESKEKMF